MANVRALRQVSHNQKLYAAGATINLKADEAQRLVDRGAAEEVGSRKKTDPDTNDSGAAK
ncbi:MAG: hypothetical protein F4X59_17450 [Holophagales bacterium]|nr:hypothetical protein [Holophagales bacterium]MYC11892.1 hypothetical protein [Holophagales bacterium]